MVSGGIALAVATMIGLLGVAIGSVLGAVLKGVELSSVSEQQGTLLHYLTFLAITALAGAIAGSIAGLVQWLILQPVSNQQLWACVRYNTMCWPISFASSFILSLIFVICGSLFQLDTPVVSIITLMGVGAVAGCMITHKLIQPTLSLSLWGREVN